MKKVYLIALLIFTIVFASCSMAGGVSEIEIINLKNGEKTSVSGDSEIAKTILKAVKSKDKDYDEAEDLISYELIINKASDADYYNIHFDLNNKEAYISHDESTYKIDDKTASELFLDENFAYTYIASTLYDSFLDYNESRLNPNIKYNWTYKNIDGVFAKKEGEIKGEINTNSVKIGPNDQLDIAYEKVPDSQVVRVYSQGNLINTGTDIQSAVNSLTADGEYTVESHAQWLLKEGLEFYGSQTLSFTVDVDNPASIEIVTKENYPGNILLVYIRNLNGDEKLSLSTEAVKTETEMYSYKEKSVFICPIDLYAQPGEYDVNVDIVGEEGDAYTISKSFTVKNKSFKTQYLTVSDDMNDTNNNDTAIYEFSQLVKPARTESASEKLWEGTFIMPVEGELTTDFAEIRFVNNEQSSSRHSGIDIAAPLGTEVKAPNSGIVTFAMEGLLSPGNTVVIDHGIGIFTSYYHFDTIAVKKGHKVSKGDIIGIVGTSGFSTGPLLHCALSIYNTYVNPYQVLSGIID